MSRMARIIRPPHRSLPEDGPFDAEGPKTPKMGAGISDGIWSLEEMVDLTN
jgi:hypothetical protein